MAIFWPYIKLIYGDSGYMQSCLFRTFWKLYSDWSFPHSILSRNPLYRCSQIAIIVIVWALMEVYIICTMLQNCSLTSAMHCSQNGKFSYGYASSPGKRSSMEDFYETRIDGVDGEVVGLFGVFDGNSSFSVTSTWLEWSAWTRVNEKRHIFICFYV